MKKILGLIFGILVLAGVCGAPAMALTCPAKTVRAGDAVNSLAECNIEKSDVGDADSITSKFGGRVVNLLLMIVGIASVVVIIIAGVIMMTSQGDAAKVKTAKNAMIYAIIGLLIALLAFTIVNYVLANVFK